MQYINFSICHKLFLYSYSISSSVCILLVVVKCGEHPGDPINITYSGAAHSVYAKSGQGCSLVEIEPTIFQLLNLRAGKDTKCGLQVRALMPGDLLDKFGSH